MKRKHWMQGSLSDAPNVSRRTVQLRLGGLPQNLDSIIFNKQREAGF
ncbi:hypothetical protein [Paenibacillus sp.]|nr:hypothetical protein [Paenibacillus sp.]